MFASVMAIVLWALSLIEIEIANLTMSTSTSPLTSYKLPNSIIGTLVFFTVIGEILVYNFDSYIRPNELVSLPVFISYVFLLRIVGSRQEFFAKVDMDILENSKNKNPQVSDSSYIQTCGETRSGWANDPRILKHIPKLFSTRLLTCFTLFEVVFMIIQCIKTPEYGGIALGLCIFAHYISDSLDGAVGRYNNEGYIMWGYYADHFFDAVYEIACALALWFLVDHEFATGEWEHYKLLYKVISPLTILLMASVVLLFHKKEIVSYRLGLSKQYSNMAGPVPFHYVEWTAGLFAFAIYFFHIPWIFANVLFVMVLSGGFAALVLWHINHPLQKIKAT